MSIPTTPPGTRMTPHFDAFHGFEDPDGADHETTRRRSARILADHELQRDADLRGFPRITNSNETRIFPDNVHTDRAAWESRSAARSAAGQTCRTGSQVPTPGFVSGLAILFCTSAPTPVSTGVRPAFIRVYPRASASRVDRAPPKRFRRQDVQRESVLHFSSPAYRDAEESRS